MTTFDNSSHVDREYKLCNLNFMLNCISPAWLSGTASHSYPNDMRRSAVVRIMHSPSSNPITNFPTAIPRAGKVFLLPSFTVAVSWKLGNWIALDGKRGQSCSRFLLGQTMCLLRQSGRFFLDVNVARQAFNCGAIYFLSMERPGVGKVSFDSRVRSGLGCLVHLLNLK